MALPPIVNPRPVRGKTTTKPASGILNAALGPGGITTVPKPVRPPVTAPGLWGANPLAAHIMLAAILGHPMFQPRG